MQFHWFSFYILLWNLNLFFLLILLNTLFQNQLFMNHQMIPKAIFRKLIVTKFTFCKTMILINQSHSKIQFPAKRTLRICEILNTLLTNCLAAALWFHYQQLRATNKTNLIFHFNGSCLMLLIRWNSKYHHLIKWNYRGVIQKETYENQSKFHSKQSQNFGNWLLLKMI